MHKSNDTYMSPYTYHPAATHSHHGIHFHTRTHTRLCFRSHSSSSVMFSLWKCILWLRTCDYVCVQRGEESCWISKLDQGHWHTHTECLATAVSQFSLSLVPWLWSLKLQFWYWILIDTPQPPFACLSLCSNEFTLISFHF